MSQDPQDQRPDERHEDFNALRSLVSTGIKTMVPLMIAGVGVLVANHFGQKTLASETAKMATEIREIRQDFKETNERVIIMWSSGNWQKQSLAQPAKQ